ncbi:unnamed protein product [Nezara viridula]|uniref:Uncharacterized protein n=1 Tax=Nezara viridula TaxID=85310 RepID=A0A9P0HSF5_NEZVI|nr:unnamed protein product [Nezara viridula]
MSRHRAVGINSDVFVPVRHFPLYPHRPALSAQFFRSTPLSVPPGVVRSPPHGRSLVEGRGCGMGYRRTCRYHGTEVQWYRG